MKKGNKELLEMHKGMGNKYAKECPKCKSPMIRWENFQFPLYGANHKAECVRCDYWEVVN